MKRMLPLLLGGLAAAGVLTQSPAARAEEPEPLHRYADDRHPPGPAQGQLLLTGALVTTAFYAPALGASFVWPDAPGASDLRIPVVGPWMKIGRTQLCDDQINPSPTCGDFQIVAGAVLLVLDGIGQAGGIALMLEGAFMNTAPSNVQRSASYVPSWRVPQAALPSPKKRPLTFVAGDFEVTPAPFVGASSDLGLALSGRF